MDYLAYLEGRSFYILREAFVRLDRLSPLWSLGKDSNVLVRLARKAFFGQVSFPAVHVETGKRFPKMHEIRDRSASEWEIVGGGLAKTKPPTSAHADPVRSTNITRVAHRVPLQQRWQTNGHKSGILWLTGLSGAGKSTLAFMLEQQLHKRGFQAYTIDGDNLRHGLCADLGFSPEDRAENIRRAGEMALGFAEAGMLVVTALISPYRSDRKRVRQIAGGLFHEIYIKADLTTCEERDPRGLYRRARSGEISEFTGVSAPYEVPANAELVVDTESQVEEESLAVLLRYVERHFGPHTLLEEAVDLKTVQRGQGTDSSSLSAGCGHT